ncbi:hypothetical protein JZ785_11910 [Alicyclobacillus curvatus]|nr:hypothetical protein JZ785_11910 [Alicyclobacillus curvatus]
MKLDTVLKVGSLAFSVANDDTVRELFTMVHKGAKRRGLIGAPMAPQAVAQQTGQQGAKTPAQAKTSQPIPFAPSPPANKSSPANPATAPDWNQLFSGQNAKKVLGVASQIGQLLMK